MGNFNKLQEWRNSKDLAVKIYMITGRGKFLDDDTLRNQLRRSVVKISSYLAEGEESETHSVCIRNFNIAIESLAKLRTQIEIAREIGYIKERDYTEINDFMGYFSKRLNRLKHFRQIQFAERT